MAFTQSDAAHTSSRRMRSPPEPDIRHRFVLVCATCEVNGTVLASSSLNEKKEVNVCCGDCF